MDAGPVGAQRSTRLGIELAVAVDGITTIAPNRPLRFRGALARLANAIMTAEARVYSNLTRSHQPEKRWTQASTACH